MGALTTEIYFRKKIEIESCEEVMARHNIQFFRKFNLLDHKNVAVVWDITVEYSQFMLPTRLLFGKPLRPTHILKIEETKKFYSHVEDELLDNNVLIENVPCRLSLSTSFNDSDDIEVMALLGDLFLKELGGVFRTRPS